MVMRVLYVIFFFLRGRNYKQDGGITVFKSYKVET